LGLSGCGGGGGGAEPGETSDATFVDANLGSDVIGSGSQLSPYRTITHALSLPTTRRTIKLAHGIYDSSTGELFPIVLSPGRHLVSDPIDTANGSAALIRGSGTFNSPAINGAVTAAVVFDDAQEIRSLVMEATDGTALWVERAGTTAQIVRSIAFSSLTGVSVVGSAAPQIRDMNILQNQQIGLEVIGSSSPELFTNTISNNGVGVVIADTANPSFGSSSEAGGNEITTNTFCDLRHLGSADVQTVGTRWDEDVFDFAISNTCANGANIVVEGSGAIDFQFIPQKETLLFPGTRRIRLDQPAFGELLFTQEPSFAWTSSGNHITILVVWTQPPIVGTGGVTSSMTNVYWLWHSGLGTGGAGNALFADGRSIEGTSINNTSAPKIFEAGRSYYWAAWEWSDDGRTVSASSPLSYFRVFN